MNNVTGVAAQQRALRTVVWFIVTFVLLAVCYGTNILGVADSKWFYSHQRDSEALVVGRLIEKEGSGLGANGGYLGWLLEGADPVEGTYRHYLSDGVSKPAGQFFIYTGQLGLQGYFLAAADGVLRDLGIAPTARLATYKSAASALLALTLTFILLLARLHFGRGAAFVGLIVLVCSPWLTVFARNLYWVPFTWFLPMAAAWYFYGQVKIREFRAAAILSLTIIVKCLCGFEYITCVSGAAFAVCVYSFALRREGISNLVVRSFVSAAIISSSVLLSVAIQIASGAAYFGSIRASWGDFLGRLGKRTYGDPAAFDPVYAASLKARVDEVLHVYWLGEPIFVIPHVVSLNAAQILLPFLAVIALSVVIINLLSLELSKIKLVPEMLLLFMSAAASISWFIVGKGHSFIHITMNYVMWHLPVAFISGIMAYQLAVQAACSIRLHHRSQSRDR